MRVIPSLLILAVLSVGVTSCNSSAALSVSDANDAFKKATAELEKGDCRSALTDINTVLKVEPDNVKALHFRAHIYSLLGQSNQQLADLDQAVKLAPEDASNYTVRGEFYASVNQYPKAYADETKAIELNPSFANYFTRGKSYFRNQNYVMALPDYQKAEQLDPSGCEIHARLAQTYLDLKQYDKAKVECDEALKINPNDGGANLAQSQLMVHLPKHR